MDTVDIYDLVLLHKTNKAYLVRDNDKYECWIPISQVESIEFGKDLIDEESHQPVKEIYRLTIPEWIAEEKGLL